MFRTNKNYQYHKRVEPTTTADTCQDVSISEILPPLWNNDCHDYSKEEIGVSHWFQLSKVYEMSENEILHGPTACSRSDPLPVSLNQLHTWRGS